MFKMYEIIFYSHQLERNMTYCTPIDSFSLCDAWKFILKNYGVVELRSITVQKYEYID